MSIVFPSSPTLNQIATVNGRQWIWDGEVWSEYGNPLATIASSGSASDLVAGVVPVERLPVATVSTGGVIQVGAGIINSAGTLSVTLASIGAAASTHKAQHATTGTDPLTPADIGAQKTIPVSSSAPTGGVNGDIALVLASASQVTPTTLSASVNDYNPGAGDIYRLSASVAVNITGWVAWLDGTTKLLVNVGSFAITLRNQNTLSAENNRFITPTGGDFNLAPGSSMVAYWDATDSRVRVF
jgi:hypothetical protein